ncbi:MAG: T9SS type A sorting domain-containing protein, partial [Bacteroidota bacterium]
MKKALLVLSLALNSMIVASQGLEGIVVEKYYVSDAADAAGSSGVLPVGSVTYRVFADLATGYNFQALYGVPDHELRVETTTSFFNNEDYGNTSPNGISATNIRKNSTMLDSWFSVGATCNGKVGVLKSEDTDGSVGNNIGILANTDPSAGIPVSTADGMMPSTPLSVTFVGINNTGNGDLAVFDGVSQLGNLFTTNNGSVAALGGSTGITPSNHVLIGQFTTDGVLSFKLNMQIGTPSGGVEQYVASNPVGSEIVFADLNYTSSSSSITNNQASTSPVTVFPNPSKDIFKLDYLWKGDYSVSVRDINGAEVMNVNGTGGSPVRLDLSSQPAGIYFALVKSDLTSFV